MAKPYYIEIDQKPSSKNWEFYGNDTDVGIDAVEAAEKAETVLKKIFDDVEAFYGNQPDEILKVVYDQIRADMEGRGLSSADAGWSFDIIAAEGEIMVGFRAIDLIDEIGVFKTCDPSDLQREAKEELCAAMTRAISRLRSSI